MTKLNVLVSLITSDNDFQKEQAASAEDAARRLDANIQIVCAGNDAVNQTQQLLKVIQGSAQRPDAILVEPVGTGMPQVAAAAAAAGIGWAVLNREVDYVAKLRGTSRTPIFAVTTDQEEVGRLQGRQFAVFLKEGGGVLYIEGLGRRDCPFTCVGNAFHQTSECNPESAQGRLDRGQRIQSRQIMVVVEHVAASADSRDRVPKRCHGPRCQESIRGSAGQSGTERLAKPAVYWLRWRTENWPGMGASWSPSGDGHHPAHRGPSLRNHDQGHSLGRPAATTHAQHAQFLSRDRRDNRKPSQNRTRDSNS